MGERNGAMRWFDPPPAPPLWSLLKASHRDTSGHHRLHSDDTHHPLDLVEASC